MFISVVSFILHLPPSGLVIRPINVALAPTSGQIGRKEAAEEVKRDVRGHPEPWQRALPSALPISANEVFGDTPDIAKALPSALLIFAS
jgi:hypothetical protein